MGKFAVCVALAQGSMLASPGPQAIALDQWDCCGQFWTNLVDGIGSWPDLVATFENEPNPVDVATGLD